MKKLLLLFAVFALCFSGYSQKIPKIDPELREEMQLRNDDELIKINIILKAQYDQFELRSKAEIYRLKEDKRSFVVNELKRYSKETQQNVMSYLDYFTSNSSVDEIKQYWIYNGINCYATKEVIDLLSYLDDILVIGFDKLENLLPYHESSFPADDGGSRELAYNVTKVNAHQVWSELGYTGEGVIVAVFDTGVNYNHNDLKTHMWTHPDYPYHGWNFANGNNNPMDDHNYQGSRGHGTHCAGTVAGNGTSGSQTGMAPDATIMALKVLNHQGGGEPSNVCNAMEFGVLHGAHVFSMSIGWASPSPTTRLLFRNAMVNVLAAGVVAAVAAGNEGQYLSWYPIPQNVRTPGDCPPPWLHPNQTTTGGISAVVCVGATNETDNIAAFSSRGPVSWQTISGYVDYPYNPGMGLIRPDLCAPGEYVKSCDNLNNSGYQTMSGTSMATPGVAGVMALMLSKNPNLTPAEICEILETTAVHLPNPTSPKGNTYGSGRINAFEAVSTAPELILCDPISDLTHTLEYDKIVNLTWNRPEDDTDLIGYLVYINGVEVPGILTEESYTLQGYEEGKYYFCIVAEYQDCSSPPVCDTIHIISICEPATELISNVAGYEVTLSWTAPELIEEVLHYNIYRDEEFLCTVVDTEIFLVKETAGVHVYSVEAEYLNECISDRISTEVLVLEAPVNLKVAQVEGSCSFELSWEYEDESMFFNLYRDEEKVASNVEEKQYTDTEVGGCIQYCYYVKATNKEIESAASNEACAAIIGVEEYANNTKIYPNPSNSIINIEGEHIEKITIFNSMGQIVKVVPSVGIINQIDVSRFASGNYVFTIHYTNNSAENVKIIVQ